MTEWKKTLGFGMLMLILRPIEQSQSAMQLVQERVANEDVLAGKIAENITPPKVTESQKSSAPLEEKRLAQQFPPELVMTYCDCGYQHPVLWVDINTLRFYPIHRRQNYAFCKPAWHEWVYKDERGVVQKVKLISVPQPLSMFQQKRKSNPALPAFREPLTPKQEPAFILPPVPPREPAPAPKPDLSPERKSEEPKTIPVPQRQRGVGRSEKIAARR